jgi:hypothetical protein
MAEFGSGQGCWTMNRLPSALSGVRFAGVSSRSLAGVLSTVVLSVAAAGCGSSDSTDAASPAADSAASSSSSATAEDDAAAKTAARRQAARDRGRARKLTRWFRVQKMTPSDLYVMGVEAPESLLKVYGISSIHVTGSKVTIKTDMYPKSDNKNEFAGACNQVVSGYGASWAKHIEVIGQDGVGHGSWDDTDGDSTDDSSGFMACQSDL